jgi:NADPH-dependent F420 reductase
MEIAVIGAGAVGKALGTGFKQAGHGVTFVTRDPAHSQEAADAIDARAANNLAEAVEGADIVVIAVRFPVSGEELGRDLAPLVKGKIVVDVTNAPRPDMSGLTFDAAGSATEAFAEMMPGARMVKAFNTILSRNMADPVIDGVPLDGFVAADDEDAKAKVMELAASVGLRPIDAGGIGAARSLEQLAWLIISLNKAQSWGFVTGWKMLGIPDEPQGNPHGH